MTAITDLTDGQRVADLEAAVTALTATVNTNGATSHAQFDVVNQIVAELSTKLDIVLARV